MLGLELELGHRLGTALGFTLGYTLGVMLSAIWRSRRQGLTFIEEVIQSEMLGKVLGFGLAATLAAAFGLGIGYGFGATLGFALMIVVGYVLGGVFGSKLDERFSLHLEHKKQTLNHQQPTSHINKTTAWLNRLSALLPERIADEDLGDAIEIIHRLIEDQTPRLRIYATTIKLAAFVFERKSTTLNGNFDLNIRFVLLLNGLDGGRRKHRGQCA